MVVYVLLASLFIFLFVYITRMSLRQIQNGLDDAKIMAEHKKNVKKNKKYKKKTGIFDIVLTVIFCCVIFGAFGFSVYSNIFNEELLQDRSVFRTVLSGSMSEKHKDNEYLFENELNDQFQQFDLILTHELPKEEDLKLYDVVVYQVGETLVVHRIVGIEEPNEKHPNERHFLLQGDALATADRFPVLYSQMRAIYRGERIRFIGSFVYFLQSPAGYMCIILVLFGVIAIPTMDNKLEKEKEKRLQLLLQAESDEENNENKA